MSKIVDSKNFSSEIASGVSVVDFFATWCGPCKMLGPIFDEAALSINDKANFFKIDIDNSSDIASSYKVSTVPTIIFFKDGEEVERIVGFVPKEKLITLTEQYM
ncbi:MAG: thioredoxin [Oscillospiraceae bacterium]|nr:thioredoxin [Oscillospiraceae bacterium]